MTTKVPFFGIKRQYQNLREEILNATDKVYSSGRVLDGDYTTEFETEMAHRCRREYAVSVNSGSQGLILAQKATLGSPDAKILIPTISFVATLNSCIMSGNTPVFCDVDDQALIDLESIDYSVKGAGVQAIMYVNMFGNTVDYDRFTTISKFFNEDIMVIEDAAQSFGASYKGIPSGKMGDVSVLSFDPTKNLNSYGSGGMVLTDNYDIHLLLQNFKDNGKYNQHDVEGTNSKMSEAECAQMLVKLAHFDHWQQRRQDIADYYTQELSEVVDCPRTTEGAVHAWHKYVIKCADRSALQSHLANLGIETKVHYSTPLYEHGIGFPYINYASELYREASAFATECLSLPIYPELTDAEVEAVVLAVKQYSS
jgi:dTDP-4-amino-4,6-dideoxygalactose transaminase